MLKIQIKSIFGKLLFEYEAEGNTILKTIQEAYLRGADLREADLRGADLQGAYLQVANLQGADLQGADLRGAYLQGAKNFEETEWTNQCRQNILFVLQNLKSEVPALRLALVE